MGLSDAVLATEAQFLYEKCVGFTPINNNLKYWRGTYRIEEEVFLIEVKIPLSFPVSPPAIRISSRDQRLSLRTDNETLQLRTIQYWSSQNHVYQAVIEAIQYIDSQIKRGVFMTDHEVIDLKEELRELKNQALHLQARERLVSEDLERIKYEREHSEAYILNLDDVRRMVIAQEELIWELDQHFDMSEIDTRVYLNKRIRLQKELEILNIKMSKMVA